jgi:hypothetical protein
VDPYDFWWSSGGRVALALDGSEKPHIAYTDVSELGFSTLRYAKKYNGLWVTEPVDSDPAKNYQGIDISAGPSINIAIDNAGFVHMAYRCSYGHGLLDNRLKYTTNQTPGINVSGEWAFSTNDQWLTGSAGCPEDTDSSGIGTISQNCENVTAIFDGMPFTGHAAGSIAELYVEYPEEGGGTTRILSYFMAVDDNNGMGEILWFSDNGVRFCNGGSRIAYNLLRGSNQPNKYCTRVSGSIIHKGNPVCAMVLANGQYMFTCNTGDDLGKYELGVPLDANNEITIQAFASGMSPFRQVTNASGLTMDIEMQTAGPESKSPTVTTITATDASTPSDWVRITGNVNYEGTPLCAMVLANGQYMFSCGDNSGVYDLTAPLDSNGQITLYVFAAGFQPYKYVFPP